MPKVPKGIGYGGSYINTDIEKILYAIVDDLGSLKAQVDDLQAKYNQHIDDGKHRVATAVDAAAPHSTLASTISTTK